MCTMKDIRQAIIDQVSEVDDYTLQDLRDYESRVQEYLLGYDPGHGWYELIAYNEKSES